MEDIPFVVQVALSAVLTKEGVVQWWDTPMWWFGWLDNLTPAQMWEHEPMLVIHRIESYLEPQVFT